MMETYRCLYCKVSLDGPDAWIEHINTSAHRQALLGPAIQRDPDDENSGYVGSLRPLFEHPDEENLSQREQELANEPEDHWSVPHRQHDND